MTSISVTPAEPVAPYLGGKRRLANRIIQRLSTISHHCYVEPFVGMGGVFLRRPFKADAEIINDISRDVATLFRVLQRHFVPLMDMLRWQITSRAEQLGHITGRFVLSLNDTPGVREVFKDFLIDSVQTVYSISGKSTAGMAEVIISNCGAEESDLFGRKAAGVDCGV
jgi:hypothetical protein